MDIHLLYAPQTNSGQYLPVSMFMADEGNHWVAKPLLIHSIGPLSSSPSIHSPQSGREKAARVWIRRCSRTRMWSPSSDPYVVSMDISNNTSSFVAKLPESYRNDIAAIEAYWVSICVSKVLKHLFSEKIREEIKPRYNFGADRWEPTSLPGGLWALPWEVKGPANWGSIGGVDDIPQCCHICQDLWFSLAAI